MITSHVDQISQIPGNTSESETNGINETNLATFSCFKKYI